jgi:hypothetical protein
MNAMGKPKNIVAAGPSGRVRIEYIEGRRVLRVSAGEGDGPVEVPLARLVDVLGIDRGDFAPPPRLLLFAGRHDLPRGGAGDLVGCYECEAEARAAFRDVRATRSDQEGWAQLVALHGSRRPTVVAWFGRPKEKDGGRRQQRLSLVAENGRHAAGRASRRHLRTVRQ